MKMDEFIVSGKDDATCATADANDGVIIDGTDGVDTGAGGGRGSGMFKSIPFSLLLTPF